METGYTTIDLVMLVIAAFIIWMVMRVPKAKPQERRKEVPPFRRIPARHHIPAAS